MPRTISLPPVTVLDDYPPIEDNADPRIPLHLSGTQDSLRSRGPGFKHAVVLDAIEAAIEKRWRGKPIYHFYQAKPHANIYTEGELTPVFPAIELLHGKASEWSNVRNELVRAFE